MVNTEQSEEVHKVHVLLGGVGYFNHHTWTTRYQGFYCTQGIYCTQGFYCTQGNITLLESQMEFGDEHVSMQNTDAFQG